MLKQFVIICALLFLAACRSATHVESLPIGRSLSDVYISGEDDDPCKEMGIDCIPEDFDGAYDVEYSERDGASMKMSAPPSKIIARVKGKKSWREMGQTDPRTAPPHVAPPTEIIAAGVPTAPKKDIAENKSDGCGKIFIFIFVFLFLALPRLSSLKEVLKNKKLGG